MCSNDGGGGERVLWCLVRAVQAKYGREKTYCIYHGDVALDGDVIINKARERFGITLVHPVRFVKLQRRAWVESSSYPILTLLGQALGSVVLGLDALLQSGATLPRIMFDTMGYAFAYPVFVRVGHCKVWTYTHYPMISMDMLQRVLERRPQYNNNNAVASSASLSKVKAMYYGVFAKCYGFVGQYSTLTMVNSTWTSNHIRSLWRSPVHVVYPAVDTSTLSSWPLQPLKRENIVISVAQFRPEKDHAMQLRAFALLLENWDSKTQHAKPPRLILIGSVRNAGDEAVVASLRALAAQLHLIEGEQFEFVKNVSYVELQSYLRRARVGLHSMCK
jgi:alpha-1,2-mannosyltransferase